MKHLGDITAINGAEIPPVDVITGGSPCQSLSVAGKRDGMAKICRLCGYKVVGNSDVDVCPNCENGLEYTRSGLFMEQIRIVKEMRENDRRNTGRSGVLVRPRYMVWENVEGAKTSPGGEHRGEDFAAVIEEIIRVSEPNSDFHVCVPDGGWPDSGCYYAEDGSWSIAYRLVDAQYFGTPQRRKRIALLADFGGLTAPEILFDPQYERTTETGEPVKAVRSFASGGQEVSAFPQSVSGHPEPGGEERQGVAAGTESGSGGSSYTLKIRGGVDVDSAGKRAGKGPLVQTELSGTLGVSQDQTLIQTVPVVAFSQNQRDEVRELGDVAGSISAETGTHQQTFIAAAVDCRNGTENEETNGTLQAKPNGGISYNLNNVVREKATAFGICSYESNAFRSSNPHSAIYKADTSRTLDNNGGNPSCNQGGIAVVEKCYPLEGNGSRPSHFGSGYGKDGDPSFTLNHVEQHGVATYDARGNGDGAVACTLTGDHQDRVTDYTALVVEGSSV